MEHVSQIKLKLPQVDERPGPTRPSSECRLCSGLGYMRVVDGVRRCECQRQKVVAAKLAQIPKRFSGAAFESYVPMDQGQERALERLRSDFTGSYFLFGDYARGKTHLAIAQYRKLVEIERPCLFLGMAELLSELRRAGMDGDYFCTVRERVRHADPFHLFLDDVDKFKATDFKFEALFDLFDTIYKRGLSLTVTSNYSLGDLTQSLDPSIVRRIDDVCQAVEV